jgi:hypothetical protein
MTGRHIRPALLAATLAVYLLPATAHAANATWTSAGADGLWSNPANWSTNTVPTHADFVYFPTTPLFTSQTITLPDGAAANRVDFYGAYSLTGGTLEVRQTDNPSGQIGNYGGRPVTIHTPLIGDTNLMLAGTFPNGTLTLDGGNTFTGEVRPSGTGVRVTRDAAFGNPANEVFFYATIVVDGTFSTARTFRPGTSQAGLNITAGNTFTLLSSIKVPGQLDKLGPGTLVLTQPVVHYIPGSTDPNPATYTTIFDGTVRLEHALALGQSTDAFQSIKMGATATLDLATGGTFNHRRIEFTADHATLRGGNGNTTLTSAIATQGRSFNLAGGALPTDSLTFNPTLVNATNSAAIISVNGPGRVILTDPVSLPGLWNIRAGGTLQINNPAAFPHFGGASESPVTLYTGTLAASGTTIPNSFTLRGGALSSGDQPGTFSGNIGIQPPITSDPTVNSEFRLSAPGVASQDLTITGRINQQHRFLVTNPAGDPASLVLTNTTNILPGNSHNLYVLPGAAITSAPAGKIGSALGQAGINLTGATLTLRSNAPTLYPSAVRAGYPATTGVPAAPATSHSTLLVDRYDADVPGGHTLSLFSLGALPGHSLTVTAAHDVRLRVTGFFNFSTVTLSPNTTLLVENTAWPPDGVTDLLAGSKLLLPYADTPRHDEARQHVLAGRLTSTSPDSGDRQAVGYAPFTDADNSTHTLVRLTLKGDANLDGAVDAADYALLDRGYTVQPASPHWFDGDFNYDGAVNDQDYLLLDRSYLLTQSPAAPLAPAFLTLRETQFGPSYVAQLIISVPEPALLSGILCPLSPLLLKRRRS